MALQSTTVKVALAGNGVTTAFSFPYFFLLDADLIVLSVDNTTGIATLKAITTDYTVTGAANPSGGTVTMLVAPATGTTLVIYRDPSITQDLDPEEYTIVPNETIEATFDKRTMIEQFIRYQVDRAMKLPIGYTGSFNPLIPDLLVAEGILSIKADLSGFEFLTPAEIAGAAGAFDETAYAYDGYSSRFSSIFTSTDLGDTLEQILLLTYTAPGISLSASGSSTTYEKGAAVTSSTLTATITKRSDPIAAVRFYKGVTLVNTVASPNPAGGSEVYSWSGSFSDNTTFNAEVDDTGATGGPSTVSASASFTFVYPYYVGAGAVGLSAAQVALLTKRVITSTVSRTETMTATAGQVFYFAYPASYGALTSILDVNGFETFPDWTLSTSNITGLDASAVSYRIYAFNNPVGAGSYQYTFVR